MHKLNKSIKTMNENTELNDHKQNCGSASAESKPDCIMPSASNFAEGKAEFQPMHNGEFDTSPIAIYTSDDNTISLDVKLENETVWLSQSQMALLFDTDRTSILRHINNVYKIGELERESTCAKIAQVRKEGKRHVTREIPYYNLDMIISVGYRVNSIRGTQFRIWANRVLKDYIVKGYAINDKIRIEHYNELKDVVRYLHTLYIHRKN